MKELFEKAGIYLSDEQCNKFRQYHHKIEEWNKHTNLTTITEWHEVKLKHFFDSIVPAKYYITIPTKEGKESNTENREKTKGIDIGTGAGFPGIPLAIVFPEIDILLLDALEKRTRFLAEVKSTLDLKNIEVIHGRAEDLGRDLRYREKFDFAVSRAVAKLSVLGEYGIPFLKIGGKFVAYKGKDIEDEMRQAVNVFSILGAERTEKYDFTLTGTDLKRSLIIAQKTKHTEDKFPRKAGKPTKKPLE
ncbi:MAG: 16S rRNA (guanine(527)-N(7))-methyltransferase RsmG [Lachnoclostridium sp.]|jgi:16S rRNA (guanine527-N7)-methyltransferase|nr:16S rRNA (guanine(527)-N(7))-methyltransferase RsmG [Lachnoclostridium sp.]